MLIADDHPVYRAGLRGIVEADPGLELAGEAATGRQAVELARRLQPDVVVMDLHLPELDGVAATGQVLRERPEVAVLVLTMSDADDTVQAALRAGARGYLLKEAGPAEIVAAIRAVAQGSTVLAPAVTRRLTDLAASGPASSAAAGGADDDSRPGGPVAFPALTSREREILDLIAAGHTNPAIAHRLVLSPKTVRNHISHIFDKLGVEQRSHAIVLARQAGLGRRP